MPSSIGSSSTFFSLSSSFILRLLSCSLRRSFSRLIAAISKRISSSSWDNPVSRSPAGRGEPNLT